MTKQAYQIHTGDVLAVLKTLPDNYFDAVLSDPPYGLSKHGDVTPVLQAWLAGVPYEHNKKGFMGKAWDGFVPGPEVYREMKRVMKPGAFALVFAGSRTQDLMGMSLRLAGLEPRDTIAWVTGQGFPKSRNLWANDLKPLAEKALRDAGYEGAIEWK